MPTLCVLRHAKSEHNLPIDDHERPLGPRGYRDAPLVGAWLRERGLRPQVVVCSSARRARDTLTGLGDLGDLGDPEIEISESLYLATGGEWLARLREVPGESTPVLVVGHNPGLQELAVELAGSGAGRASLASAFPTAALAVLEFAGGWTGLARGAAHLAAFVRPRELARGAAP